MDGTLDDSLLTSQTYEQQSETSVFRTDSPALFNKSRSYHLDGDHASIYRDTMTTPSADHRLTVLPGGGGALLAINSSPDGLRSSDGSSKSGRSSADALSHRGTTSSVSAVFLLMNAILGSGILGQAYAMRSAGAVLFCFLLVGMSLAAHYAVVLLTRACEAAKVVSYEQLGEVAMGYRWKVLATVTIMLQNTGALIGYIVILGDLVPPLIRQVAQGHGGHYHHHDSGGDDGSTPFFQRRWVLMALVVLCVDLPMACFKDIGMLGYGSGASIIIMVFFAVLYAVEAVRFKAKGDDMCDPGQTSGEGCDFRLAHVDEQTAITFPTLAFSFVCHTSLLPIYTELHDRRPSVMQSISMCAMASCMLLYFTAGIAGYASFRGAVLPDSLESLQAVEEKNAAVLVLRILVCVSIAVTVPLIHFPFRRAATLLFFADYPFSWVRHVGIAVCMLTLVTVIAIFLPGIRTVFGLVGATTSVMLVFVLPSLFFEGVYAGVADGLKAALESRRRGDRASGGSGGDGGGSGGDHDGGGGGGAHPVFDGYARGRKQQPHDVQMSPVRGATQGEGTGGKDGGIGRFMLDEGEDGGLLDGHGGDEPAVELHESVEELEERLRWIELHRWGAKFMIGGGAVVGLVSLGGIIYGWTA